jgi:hypothetical protein
VDTKTGQKREGQAIVEFMVAIIAVLAVMAGIIFIGRLQLAHTQTMIDARYEVANSLLSPQSMMSYDATWLHGWNYGNDDRPYTADDTPIYSFVAKDVAANIAENSMLQTLPQVPQNRISAFLQSSTYSDFLPMVKGERLVTVDFSDIPFLGNFFGFSQSISVKTKLYMTWGGSLQ